MLCFGSNKEISRCRIVFQQVNLARIKIPEIHVNKNTPLQRTAIKVYEHQERPKYRHQYEEKVEDEENKS